MGLCCSKASNQDETSSHHGATPLITEPESITVPVRASAYHERPHNSSSPLQPHSSLGPQRLPQPHTEATIRHSQYSCYSHVDQCEPVRINRNEILLVELLRCFETHHIPVIPQGSPCDLESLDPKSERFVINVLFRNKRFGELYQLINVKRVWNPYLMLHYMLNKRKYGDKFKERHMYHGTSVSSAHAILTHNFNWRMVNEYTFGKGVYFANNPYYASHYGKKRSHVMLKDYVMIVAKVLVEETEIERGFPHSIPPAGHSSTSDNKQELIKFDDCVFYPEFLVHYRPFAI